MSTLGRLLPHRMDSPRAVSRITVCALALVASACASAPSPPYRDFEVRGLPAAATDEAALTARLRSAVEAAGWTPTPALAAGVVTTSARSVRGGAFGRTTAALDLVPLNEGPAGAETARYVRVVVRAEQRSFLGGRSKVYALNSRLREELLGPITEALAARGLVALGTPRDRDEDATDD